MALPDAHVPTTPFQKILLTLGSGLVALANPLRADMVATLGETTGRPALLCMRRKMLATHEGRLILREQPRINENTLPLDRLLQLPPNSLGHQYATWMRRHHFSSNERPIVRFVDDPELAYVLQRYREVHDFWHVLADLDVSELEELALKQFEFLHTGLPVAALSALFGPLRLTPCQQTQLLTKCLPWAIQCQRSTTFLLNVRYEALLHRDLQDVRQCLGFVKFEP